MDGKATFLQERQDAFPAAGCFRHDQDFAGVLLRESTKRFQRVFAATVQTNCRNIQEGIFFSVWFGSGQQYAWRVLDFREEGFFIQE